MEQLMEAGAYAAFTYLSDTEAVVKAMFEDISR